MTPLNRPLNRSLCRSLILTWSLVISHWSLQAATPTVPVTAARAGALLLAPTNFLISNILAGLNITITSDPSNRITIASTPIISGATNIGVGVGLAADTNAAGAIIVKSLQGTNGTTIITNATTAVIDASATTNGLDTIAHVNAATNTIHALLQSTVLSSIRTQTVSVGSVTGINFGNGITGTVASSQLNLGVSSASSATTEIWVGQNVSAAVTLGVYRYAPVSGTSGLTVSSTNTLAANIAAANFTVTGLSFYTANTAILGAGTNMTIAFQTNGIDACTFTLTGNASRRVAYLLGQSIPVTTNDNFNLRWTADGNIASQTYGTTVTYTVP